MCYNIATEKLSEIQQSEENLMKETQYGALSVIGMKGCEEFAAQVDYYLKEWRRHGGEESFLVQAECPRFGSGEAKALLHESLRGC